MVDNTCELPVISNVSTQSIGSKDDTPFNFLKSLQKCTDPFGLGTQTGGLLQGLVDSSKTPRCNMVCTSLSIISLKVNNVGHRGALTINPGGVWV